MIVTVGPKIPESSIAATVDKASSGFLSTKNSVEAIGTATAAASFDININLPAGVKIIATSLRVDTALTSSNGGNAFIATYIGGSSLHITSTGAFGKNTKVNKFHDAVGSETSATTNIRIKCNDEKLFASGGKITAITYYQELTSMASV